VGWRGVFVLIAALVAVAMLALAWVLPKWQTTVVVPSPAPSAGSAVANAPELGYREIFAHPYFRKMALIGCFNYGGMVAIQALWAGPWLVQVAGHTPAQAAQGLFNINVCMLIAFLLWGWLNPRFVAKGWSADFMIARGLPLSMIALACAIALGPQAHWWAWAAFCVLSTFTSLTQPAVGMAFVPQAAGKALSAYNLLIFAGVFIVQWGIGLLIDGFSSWGLAKVQAYQAAFAVYGLCCAISYGWFLKAPAPRQ
jgi:predicted MFS family arabinose efflux permease